MSILYNKILQGITTKQSAYKILKFIISHPDRLYHEDDCKKAFSACCKIGAYVFLVFAVDNVLSNHSIHFIETE